MTVPLDLQQSVDGSLKLEHLLGGNTLKALDEADKLILDRAEFLDDGFC